MLYPLAIEATHTTPRVSYDATTGRCLIEGRAMPIDAGAFFEPILAWIDAYAEQPLPSTQFIFHMDYFNSGASLLVARLMFKLNQVPGAKIFWHYHPDDEDILEAGHEFARVTHVPFHFVPQAD